MNAIEFVSSRMPSKPSALKFVDRTKAFVDKLPNDSRERIILTYLLENAVGLDNAKPWTEINHELRRRGKYMTKREFQQNTLKESRANGAFIGSTHSGYFLIATGKDYLTVVDFYLRRLEAEQKNLDHLTNLFNNDIDL